MTNVSRVLHVTATIPDLSQPPGQWRLKGGFGSGPPATFPDDYTEVAHVEHRPTDLFFKELAFDRTNHVDGAWYDNRGVTKTVPYAVRSTSVGDVVIEPDGRAWRVESMGWTLLGA